jgi:hypothetical protein
MKKVLVNYEFTSGEFSCNGHTLVCVGNRQKPENAVHNYFMDFYGEKNAECEQKAYYYLYLGGQVSVTIRGIQPTTEEQVKTLNHFSIL